MYPEKNKKKIEFEKDKNLIDEELFEDLKNIIDLNPDSELPIIIKKRKKENLFEELDNIIDYNQDSDHPISLKKTKQKHIKK
jgi:hypothetical protein